MLDEAEKIVGDCFFMKDLNNEWTWSWYEALLFKPDHFFISLAMLTMAKRIATAEGIPLPPGVKRWYDVLTSELKRDIGAIRPAPLTADEQKLPPRSCTADGYGKESVRAARRMTALPRTLVQSKLFADHHEMVSYNVQALALVHFHRSLYYLAHYETDPALVAIYKSTLKDVVYPMSKRTQYPALDFMYVAAMGRDLGAAERQKIVDRARTILNQHRRTPPPFDRPDRELAGDADKTNVASYYFDYRAIESLRDPLCHYLIAEGKSLKQIPARSCGTYALGPARVPLDPWYPTPYRLWQKVLAEEADKAEPNFEPYVFGQDEVGAEGAKLRTLVTSAGHDFVFNYWLGRYHGLLPLPPPAR
jgi:hypothetical protein